jgi:hypothetical protein
MMGRIWWVPVLLLAAACGSEDEKSESEKPCDQGKAKAAECGGRLASGVCDSPCVLQCVVDATCDDLRGTPPNPFFVCQAVCQGVSDPFFCKNGRQVLPKSGVCDGRFQCDDGSDEENCTTRDAG